MHYYDDDIVVECERELHDLLVRVFINCSG